MAKRTNRTSRSRSEAAMGAKTAHSSLATNDKERREIVKRATELVRESRRLSQPVSRQSTPTEVGRAMVRNKQVSAGSAHH